LGLFVRPGTDYAISVLMMVDNSKLMPRRRFRADSAQELQRRWLMWLVVSRVNALVWAL
jgi:hypothetical protein